MLIWNVFLGWGDGYVILTQTRLRKFYGGWLTQRPTAYLPSDKNAHSQTHQDKSIIPPFAAPRVLCGKKPIYTSHQMDTQSHSKTSPQSLCSIVDFPGYLPLWKPLVLVFLFPIYQDRHSASWVGFTSRAQTVQRHTIWWCEGKQNRSSNNKALYSPSARVTEDLEWP